MKDNIIKEHKYHMVLELRDLQIDHYTRGILLMENFMAMED